MNSEKDKCLQRIYELEADMNSMPGYKEAFQNLIKKHFRDYFWELRE